MKKAVITLALVLALGTSGVLASCTANTTTDGNGAGNGTSTGTATTAPQETSTEGNGTGNVIDEAESKMEDMSEHATHGVEDGTPGGHSTRGGARHLPPLPIPRGK